MDGLLDLLFTLLALAGKYWFLILGYVVYRMLGLDKKKSEQKRKQHRMPPPLTPTTAGGQPGRMTAGQKPDAQPPRAQPEESDVLFEESGEGVPDWKPIPQASLTYVEESDEDAKRTGGAVPTFRDAAPLKTHVPVEPPSSIPKEKLREGMKWAIILSEPRSKAPYRPIQSGKQPK